MKREILNLRLITDKTLKDLGPTEHRVLDKFGDLFEMKMMTKRKEQQLADKEKIAKGVKHYQETGMADLRAITEQLKNVSTLLTEESGEAGKIEELWKEIQNKVNQQSVRSM